jgi:hypothetical protein
MELLLRNVPVSSEVSGTHAHAHIYPHTCTCTHTHTHTHTHSLYDDDDLISLLLF